MILIWDIRQDRQFVNKNWTNLQLKIHLISFGNFLTTVKFGNYSRTILPLAYYHIQAHRYIPPHAEQNMPCNYSTWSLTSLSGRIHDRAGVGSPVAIHVNIADEPSLAYCGLLVIAIIGTTKIGTIFKFEYFNIQTLKLTVI